MRSTWSWSKDPAVGLPSLWMTRSSIAWPATTKYCRSQPATLAAAGGARGRAGRGPGGRGGVPIGGGPLSAGRGRDRAQAGRAGIASGRCYHAQYLVGAGLFVLVADLPGSATTLSAPRLLRVPVNRYSS